MEHDHKERFPLLATSPGAAGPDTAALPVIRFMTRAPARAVSELCGRGNGCGQNERGFFGGKRQGVEKAGRFFWWWRKWAEIASRFGQVR